MCTGWGSSGRWTIGKPGGAAESASGAADAGAGAGAGASAGADDKDRRHGGASSDSDVRLGLECLPVVTPDRYNYVFVLDVEEYNAVVFSVAANNDAHVALGPSKVHDGRHYEFVIGGWGNTKCVIRERKQGPPVAFADGRFLGGMAEERKFWLRWGSGPDGLLEFGRGHDVGHDVVMTARMSFGLRITSMVSALACNAGSVRSAVRALALCVGADTGCVLNCVSNCCCAAPLGDHATPA